MSAPNIPAILRRLAELHAIYTAPDTSWWKRCDAKQRAFGYLSKHGQAILEYITALEASAQANTAAVAKARREAFQSGRWEEHKYLTALAKWRKTKKGKMPKEPKPL
jgi:hypothetical protein